VCNRCLRRLAALGAIVFLGIPGRSQSTGLPTTVDGELHTEAPALFLDYRVELADPNHSNDTHRVDVGFDGTFHLRDIRSGQYMLRVTTLNGGLVHQEFVAVSPQAGPLTARAALRLDSGFPQAHLILGSILAVDPRTRAESIPHLERAAETLPSARATLEKLRHER
jgi:hypothetical protein